MAQTLLSEGGTDRRQFPTVTHCCAWLGRAPHHDVSGGQGLRSRTLQVVSRATQAVRQAAQAVAQSGSSVGADCRAMRARRGPQQATVATAHTIARGVSHRLKYREPCNAESATAYERQRRERALNHLTRRASKLGDMLTPVAISQPTSPV
jgi:transposase